MLSHAHPPRPIRLPADPQSAALLKLARILLSIAQEQQAEQAQPQPDGRFAMRGNHQHQDVRP